MTFEEFKKLPAQDRLAEVNENATWLTDLTEEELDEVGRLLCHATGLLHRKRMPIIGDSPDDPARVAQERLETERFGYSKPIDEETQ